MFVLFLTVVENVFICLDAGLVGIIVVDSVPKDKDRNNFIFLKEDLHDVKFNQRWYYILSVIISYFRKVIFMDYVSQDASNGINTNLSDLVAGKLTKILLKDNKNTCYII